MYSTLKVRVISITNLKLSLHPTTHHVTTILYSVTLEPEMYQTGLYSDL